MLHRPVEPARIIGKFEAEGPAEVAANPVLRAVRDFACTITTTHVECLHLDVEGLQLWRRVGIKTGLN